MHLLENHRIVGDHSCRLSNESSKNSFVAARNCCDNVEHELLINACLSPYAHGHVIAESEEATPLVNVVGCPPPNVLNGRRLADVDATIVVGLLDFVVYDNRSSVFLENKNEPRIPRMRTKGGFDGIYPDGMDGAEAGGWVRDVLPLVNCDNIGAYAKFMIAMTPGKTNGWTFDNNFLR